MSKPIQEFELNMIKSHLWKDTEANWAVIVKWCHDNNTTVANLLNSMLPAISFCVQNYTTANENGMPQVELNLGKITLRPRYRPPWIYMKKH
jgi:hypothetical protein